MSAPFHFKHRGAVDLRLDRVGQKTRCVGAVVQVFQLGSAGRVRCVKARDGPQLHMGDHQRPDVADIEFDFGAPGVGAVSAPVTALKQAAIDQQPRVVVQRQLVA